MTEHDFESIQRIFERASELAPEDRLDFLEEACGGDTKLISHVAELLRSHDDPVVIRAVEQSWPRPVEVVGSTNDSAGRRIGPYRIVRRIGVGGMGAVYLARRDDDQFDQEVALKLISIGIPGAEAWSRFRDERQILARLNHPHIARLLDGGMTSEGLLYFVMEYVDGVPIDRHCSVEHLEYRDRLRLFLDVCSAVQHAHSMLVVHRDLKPANVLVDRSGSVRLLDFGIAKSLEAEQRETLTRTGISPMTPEYASPEQARGEPVTTASDVYSLGVMLHLLLTGRLPYELRGASPAEIERIITSAEPEKPSRVVRSEGGDPALVRALESELDLVIARTLHKDPARRYATVDQLAEDIGRHLDGKPVLARGDAFSYRAAKFIGRNRLLVSAAAILALVIVAGSISTAWQARTARRQAALAEAERDRALVESRKADEVARFLTGLFEVADPTSEVPDTLQVDEILDRGAFRIESELNGQPELQASLLRVLGQIYRSRGLVERSHDLLDRSLRISREVYGPEHVEVGRALNALGVQAQYEGDYAEAETLSRDALTIFETSHSGPHDDLVTAYHNLGTSLGARGDLEGAERWIRRAIEMEHVLNETETPQLAGQLSNLASILARSDRFEEADSLNRDALRMQRSLLGDGHIDVALSLNALGTSLYRRGELAEAAPLLREALEIRQRALGRRHPLVAMSLHNLASVEEKLGDLASAERHFRESLEIKRAMLGDDHPTVATGMNNLGLLLLAEGRLADAEPLLERSLEVRRAVYGEADARVARGIHNLGMLALQEGDTTLAAERLEKALELRVQVLGEDHLDVAVSCSALGGLLESRGRLTEARALFARSLDIRRRKLAPEHPDVVSDQAALRRLPE